MANEEFVVELKTLDAQALPRVGGKAANLGELISAGFPVPPGFVVTTAAYRNVADALDVSDPGRARQALAGAELPAAVAKAVLAAYPALGADAPVAVRSSATAEDLPWASFAGQQDTYLNVVGADAVLDAVRRCWGSLWTERAVSYRETQGIDHQAVHIAVVVQRMVDVQVAGVLFTADPVTGTRHRAVIDASPGLGEAVVSGAVNPDHIVVDADGVHVTPGDKTVQVRALPGGGTEQVSVAAGAEACLTDEQAVALSDLGRRVEAHFGAPQDIEWAVDTEGELWLTQARPITTLHPLPAPSGDGLRVLFCASLAQGLTRPVTPMGLSGFRVLASTAAELAFGAPVADPVAGPPVLRTAGGRAFIDVTAALRSNPGRALLPRALDLMESRSAVVLRGLLDDPRLSPTTTSWTPFVRRLVRTLIRFRVPVLMALALLRPDAARRRVERVGDRVRTLTSAPPGLTADERLDRAVHVLRQAFPVLPRTVPAAGAGFVMLGLARRLAGTDLGADGVHEVLRSLPHNSTTEMDLRLWTLARKLSGDPASAAALRDTPPAELARRYRDGVLPPALESGLAAFLVRHGHRAVAEIDIGVPRWSEDQTHVLGMLANYLRLDDLSHAPDAVFARGAEAADAAVSATVGRVRARSRLRAVAVGFALDRMRRLAGLREEHKDFLIRIFAHVRALLTAVGTDLAGHGLLDRADDVFFLDLAEARAALGGADLRETVAARRAEYDRELRRRRIPRVLLSDGTEPEAVAVPTGVEGALVGTAASAGTATAPARVVLDPVGARLEPGEILVAPSTDPGWTPLFLTAGGLVMEMGGPNSHGAVVAREYGIPAVVGVADATTRISTGQEVTVDGAAGTVRVTS
ncbi:PEP/pyruvate-binding domain-containing protein [Pseudonocardia cypriaca]|uniref:Pyruvate,water dikinase n=1 Tax=Pseudonocardia cypriaca TaxID=882449 RepID=A0A543FUV8_9PSEU|nr:PEP/pyruvate-binding domain-containing protein [Pseudonocardia cypriaca]TQM37617.1 pyruvate,water dikinase [Pseudonocardia cypriaca]